MTDIFKMPNEVIHNVNSYLEDKDILSMNSTCKKLRAASRTTFVATFGTDLTFNLTKEGMSHLHRLSRSSKRPYIRTIIFVHNGRSHDATYLELMEAARYLELMESGFENLSVTGNLASIGIRHADTGAGFEPDKQVAWENISCFLSSNILKRAQKTGLLIKNIIFEHEVHPRIYESHQTLYTPTYQPQDHDSMASEATQIMTSMEKIQNIPFADADHTIRFVNKGTGGTRKSAFMTYSPRNNSFLGFHLTLSLQVWMENWFPTMRRLTSITLSDCEIDHCTLIAFFSSHPLERITLDHIKHFNGPFGSPQLWFYRGRQTAQPHGYWQQLFRALLERCPSLSFCRLSRLMYGGKVVFTGPTWEATGAQEVREMLLGFRSGGGSRSRPELAFKKAGAITTGPRKPRKKPVKNKKTRWTHRKAKPKN